MILILSLNGRVIKRSPMSGFAVLCRDFRISWYGGEMEGPLLIWGFLKGRPGGTGFQPVRCALTLLWTDRKTG